MVISKLKKNLLPQADEEKLKKAQKNIVSIMDGTKFFVDEIAMNDRRYQNLLYAEYIIAEHAIGLIHEQTDLSYLEACNYRYVL
ncbi:hypothetical protein MRY82_06220 [bacterium]|nr:hypothetical protein [bacterium]